MNISITCRPAAFWIVGFAIIAGVTNALPAQVPKPAIEPWADSSLPVKDGLVFWLDAPRQFDAWAAHDRSLVAQEPFDVFYDASGHQRHFTQPQRPAQPKLIGGKSIAAIRMDGEDDFLRCNGPDLTLRETTVFIVASARTNAGGFRAYLSASENGKNDFDNGFNVDMGPPPSDGGFGILYLNVEGKGFVGAQDLLEGGLPLEELNRLAVTIAPGQGNVRISANGQPPARRDRRDNGPLKINNFVVGARLLSNEDLTPYVRSFLHGDVAEVIAYDRVLSDDEIKSVDDYLATKYEAGADALNRSIARGTPLVPVKNPPPVQMFVPGFESRTLPVDLTNINNVRYRSDGKLVTVAYDGNIYLLSDTDGDGLEEKVETFWKNESQIVAPIGCALTPPGYAHGDGVFVACKGKLSLIVDTNKDDVADKEIIVATGWPPTFSPVDALGVAIGPDQSIYFGLGCANFISAYMPDDSGKAQYSLTSERGTILRVSPDFKNREIVCTGIRFPVGMAFNAQGDLFCTDQEGATWLPNGNPFDELLHIRPKLHYGFPPRHPTLLPNVVDEPSTFDFSPQHQSACGLCFNEPVNGGPTFGPEAWHGDALVCGESRGKLWRTKLVKSGAGYIAQTQLIASLSMLAIDSCVSPAGDLVVTVHSGNPDWGTGPKGKGKLYKISYSHNKLPQPVLTYASGPGEVRVAFDRELDIAALRDWSANTRIEMGRYVGAGDRFENIRPGYAVVKRQMHEPREKVSVGSIQVTPDHRTLLISTNPQKQAGHFGLTLPGFDVPPPRKAAERQINEIDLEYDLHGIEAAWQSADGKQHWTGWLPHPDLAVSRAFTIGSAEHNALWAMLSAPGTLTLKTQLDLFNLLHPAIQPGSTLDYTPELEHITILVRSASQFSLRNGASMIQSTKDGDRHLATMQVTAEPGKWTPLQIELQTGHAAPSVSSSFISTESETERPLALRRFYLPWAVPLLDDQLPPAGAEPIPQLAGGNWMRGRKVFFGIEAGCSKCHSVNGAGTDLGPDLSNLIHRDYDSVLRDIRDPSGALNPDYIASNVVMKNGKVLSGIMRNTDPGHFIVRGDLEGERAPIARSEVKTITASKLSIMPSGVAEGIGEEKLRDLLTFLLTEPLQPAPIERKGAPPARSKAEVDAILQKADVAAATQSVAPLRPLRVTLLAGPKDHGIGEHDYPLWQRRWTTLLSLADNIIVDQANEWPTAEQWRNSDVVVNFSSNAGWSAERGKDLDAFFARGGGYVLLHWAVNGQADPASLAERVGLASHMGIGFRHGPVDLTFRDRAHPITRGFTTLHFEDETYWKMVGNTGRIHLLADAVEEGKPWPQLWTMEHEKGRVFTCIMGHYNWTFDDPLFRILVLRGICWSAGESDVDRLSALATIGARLKP